MVKAYPNIGLVTALYVKNNVSLCLPHLVEERTLCIIIILNALAIRLSLCLLYVNLRPRVHEVQYLVMYVHV